MFYSTLSMTSMRHLKTILFLILTSCSTNQCSVLQRTVYDVHTSPQNCALLTPTGSSTKKCIVFKYAIYDVHASPKNYGLLRSLAPLPERGGVLQYNIYDVHVLPKTCALRMATSSSANKNVWA